ncbi:unnamed protein product [Alopecurus aequalis]
MEAGVIGGNCAGLVAVAAVSAAVTLATVRLYRGLESDFRRKIQFQHGGKSSGVRSATVKKKKVRFADDVTEPSSNNKEYRRRWQRFAVVAGHT